jgi:5-(carboxyamino)imidazole ribonucleotide synthase
MILPGQTIGILGGGQLGRMFAIAARRMGYRVHALDPTADCPTGQVADYEVTADYDDLDAARRFAHGVDVVTFEFENIPAETLAAIEQIRPVHPSPFVLQTTRHRLREKEFLHSRSFPVARFQRVTSAAAVRVAVDEFAGPSILKTAEFGYDGKGQVRIDSVAQAEGAWLKLDASIGVLEQLVSFDREISVIGARFESGSFHCWSPFENVHRNGILDVTTWPASVSQRVAGRARELATEIALALDLRGVMCVEMFVIGDDLIVNEIAPRPHNSGHLTFDAAVTSQFEQQLRAVCGLPPGDLSIPWEGAAMVNLMGDLWSSGAPDFSAVLRDPGVKLHLYGKQTPRPGRKMGHLTAMHSGGAEAAKRMVLAARDAMAARFPVPRDA